MDKEIYSVLSVLVDEALPWAIELRRTFHRWPETGNEEVRTIQRIKKELSELGIDPKQLLNTGIVGNINGSLKGPGKVIAFRADIDALPMQENIRLPFASVREGFMHSCGHDVHTAILLGTAKVLSRLQNRLENSVKFIFQPAEETTGGAERMIAAGCLKNPDVSTIYGLHVKPELSAGIIGYQYGRVHASSDIFLIRVKGRSSHGANPHSGIDALVAGCQIVTNLQAVISRSVNPFEPAVISIGRFNSGQAVNIIADEAVIEGTIRTFDKEMREFLRERVKNTAEWTAKAAGADVEVEFTSGYDALFNHDKPVNKVKNKAESLLGNENVIELNTPSMGVEDFTYYLKHVPGAFFFLGSGFPYRYNPPIHSDNFHVNEDCIRTGIMMFCGLAFDNEVPL